MTAVRTTREEPAVRDSTFTEGNHSAQKLVARIAFVPDLKTTSTVETTVLWGEQQWLLTWSALIGVYR